MSTSLFAVLGRQMKAFKVVFLFLVVMFCIEQITVLGDADDKLSTVGTERIFYVCECGDEKFLGKYVQGDEMSKMDGIIPYFNEKDMAIYRYKGFWYLGNVEEWPPVTNYRCVQEIGCNYGIDHPPTSKEGTWAASGRGKVPAPVVLNTPCEQKESSSTLANEEL